MNSNHNSIDWHSFIDEHPLFGELTPEDITNLLDPANSKPRAFRREEVIFRAGELSNSFFLIGEGSVRVELSSEDSSATNICTLYKGDYFGEMSAIDEKSGRAATILACEDCTLLEIKSRPFQQILKSNPELEFKLLSMLAERLRHVNDHLLKSTRLSYETKFSILSEKIESQSKVVEASLNASQAVFEQTKIRTSEIINAAERGRSRITWVMSTLTAGFTLLLGLFSFLGYDKLNTAEEKLEQIQKVESSVKSTLENIRGTEIYIIEARTKVNALSASVEEVEQTVTKLKKAVSESEVAKRILFETLIPIFSVQVEEKVKNGSESDPGDLGIQILKINDNLITTKLFKELFFMIETSHQYILDNFDELSEPGLAQKKRRDIEQDSKLNRARISYCTSFMYLYIHNTSIEKADNPLAHFLSNYILLATYAMNDQYANDNDVYNEINPAIYPRDNFNKRLNELNRKYSDAEGDRIKKLLDKEFIFDLRDITLAVNEDLNDRKNLIDEVWSYIN